MTLPSKNQCNKLVKGQIVWICVIAKGTFVLGQREYKYWLTGQYTGASYKYNINICHNENGFFLIWGISLAPSFGSICNFHFFACTFGWCNHPLFLAFSFLTLYLILAAENSIEELPSSVCNLVHLKSLCLNNNNVKQVSLWYGLLILLASATLIKLICFTQFGYLHAFHVILHVSISTIRH